MDESTSVADSLPDDNGSKVRYSLFRGREQERRRDGEGPEREGKRERGEPERKREREGGEMETEKEREADRERARGTDINTDATDSGATLK